MNRMKKLATMLLVLVFTCIATVTVSKYVEKKEEIHTSGETILAIQPTEVQSVCWDADLSFHYENGWYWDNDTNFPIDGEKMKNLLNIFSDIKAAFIIEQPEDLSAYGLERPEYTINLSTEDEQYTFLLGNLSEMDSQRYFSMGDGNVYLITEDITEQLNISADDLMLHDDIPDFDTIQEISFTGLENYTVVLSENSTAAYKLQDIYFATIEGQSLPTDTDNVEDYLSFITSLSLNNYASYNLTDELLAEYGLDNPQLTVTVKYTNESSAENINEFVLTIGRNPSELLENDEDDAGDESITAYVRIADSQVVYTLTSDEYVKLTQVSYNDLRSSKLFPADFDDVTAMEITLEEEIYTITTEINNKDESVFMLDNEEVGLSLFKTRLNSIESVEYTDIKPTGKEEIRVLFHINNENHPQVELVLYRYDGEKCVATINEQTISFVNRSDTVDFIEAVNKIVLD